MKLLLCFLVLFTFQVRADSLPVLNCEFEHVDDLLVLEKAKDVSIPLKKVVHGDLFVSENISYMKYVINVQATLSKNTKESSIQIFIYLDKNDKTDKIVATKGKSEASLAYYNEPNSIAVSCKIGKH